MKSCLKTYLLPAALLLSSFSISANDFMVRVRSISVTPAESGSPTLVGGDVKISNDSVPEIDFTYFLNDSFAFELILATTTHQASVHKSSLDNVNLGNVSLLPPTLLAQYHHTFGKFKPYVGAGINYTIFYDADFGMAENVSYDNSFGYALQLGLDYQIADRVYLNLDIKKLYLSTDVKVTTYTPAATVTADVDINPLIIGIGLGYRF